jgi:nucleoside-diphosphate-sugar epimerase
MGTLVTCATGSVSRAFVRSLRQRGEDANVLIRDASRASTFANERVFMGDVFDSDLLRRAAAGVDTIVHVSPRVYPTGDIASQLVAHRRSHVESTRLVLEAGLSQGVERFLFVSSAHAGGRGTEQAMCETAGGMPDTPYAQAKLEAEEVALAYADRHALHVLILRPPGVYGPGDKSLVSPLWRAARLGIWLPLEGVQAVHSLVFADDLARAGLDLLEASGSGSRPRVFNVKDPVDYRPRDLYADVCRAHGRKPLLFRMPDEMLSVLGAIGTRSRSVPGLRSLAVLRQFLTLQRYCGHLFEEALPAFRFTGFGSAAEAVASRRLDR